MRSAENATFRDHLLERLRDDEEFRVKIVEHYLRAEEAKNILRQAGYGVIGQDILDTAKDAAESVAHSVRAVAYTMTREDYHRVSEIVDGEAFAEPEGVEQAIWNMALKHAAGMVRRAGHESGAPWAERANK